MWDSAIAWNGDPDVVRLSASDLGNHGSTCPAQVALGIRPSVRPHLGDWRKLYPATSNFPLGLVRDIAQAAHSDPSAATYGGLKARIKLELDLRPRVHPGVKRFAAEAVEHYMDLHDEVEAELGSLTFIEPDDEWRGYVAGTVRRKLTAWALMYETAGCEYREIRRLRMTTGNDRGDAAAWAGVAARIASRPPSPARVRVTQVGVADTSIEVLFDGSADQALAYYEENARPHIPVIMEGGTPAPGRDCGECKYVGACPALQRSPGLLGLDQPGVSTRSISASDLDLYGKCPARWLLERSLHLPSADTSGTARIRGTAAHRWLRAAHARGIACTELDLPEPTAGATQVALGVLDDHEYALAYPFLRHHIAQCPFAGNLPIVEFAGETSLYGYDPEADLIVVTKPDARYRIGDALVLRETKTFDGELPADEGAAYDKWFSVAWGLNILHHGLAENYGAQHGEFHLEVLTPEAGAVYVFTTSTPLYPQLAHDEVRRLIADWHTDDRWDARPGRQCEWCPVAHWCPSALVGQEATGVNSPLAGSGL